MTKNGYWALIIILLLAVIITGSVTAWQRYRQPLPIEISFGERLWVETKSKH